MPTSLRKSVNERLKRPCCFNVQARERWRFHVNDSASTFTRVPANCVNENATCVLGAGQQHRDLQGVASGPALGVLLLVVLSQIGSVSKHRGGSNEASSNRGDKTSVRGRMALASATSVSCFKIGRDDRAGTDVVVWMSAPLSRGRRGAAKRLCCLAELVATGSRSNGASRLLPEIAHGATLDRQGVVLEASRTVPGRSLGAALTA